MTPDEREREILKIMEESMRQMGVYTTAHYDACKGMIAAAIRDERACCQVRVKDAIAAERNRAARLAWKMQMEQFGGGTAIGNAIQDGVNP